MSLSYVINIFLCICYLDYKMKDSRHAIQIKFEQSYVIVKATKTYLCHKNINLVETFSSFIDNVKVKVAQWCLTLCDPMDYTVHGILQSRILEWVAFPFSRGSFQPGIEPTSPALQTDSLPAEPQGKSKNTGVSSITLLQLIFPTQESNQGLLLCRRILYQLSYQGIVMVTAYFNIGFLQLLIFTNSLLLTLLE